MKDKNCPQVSTILEVCSQLLRIVQQSNVPDTANKEAAFLSPSNGTLLTTNIYKESTVKCRTVQMVVHMPKILNFIVTEEIILTQTYPWIKLLSVSTILSPNTGFPSQTQSTHKQVANVLKTSKEEWLILNMWTFERGKKQIVNPETIKVTLHKTLKTNMPFKKLVFKQGRIS